MADLFDALPTDAPKDAPRPLADRMRPKKLSDVIGQDQVLGPDAPLGVMLASNSLGSLIFWGPPGVGKTTIARLLADETDLHFVQISAIFTGVPDLRKVFEAAKHRRSNGQGTLLFVDEIHRFNKAQQDGFLPHMEDGTILLVGATTENPSLRAELRPTQPRAGAGPGTAVARRPGASGAAGREGTGQGAAARRPGARGAAGDGRRRRARAAEPDRTNRRLENRQEAGPRRAGRPADEARRAIRQIRRRPLQPDLGAAQIRPRLGPRRRAVLAGTDADRR